MDTTSGPKKANPVRRRLLLAAAVVAGIAAVPVAASAQDPGPSPEAAVETAPAPVAEEAEADILAEAEAECGVVFDIESDAEIEALENELAAHLDEAGVDYRWEDEDGYRWVEVDEDDATALEAMDAFFDERFPLTDEQIECLDAIEDDLLAEFEIDEQELENELAAHLDEAGVDYRWVEEDGYRWVEVDEDDDAAVEAMDAFFDERFPFDEGEYCDDEADDGS